MDAETAKQMIRDGWCPFCPAGPFRSVGNHTVMKHGYTAEDVRIRFGLLLGQPLCTPDLSDEHADRAGAPHNLATFDEYRKRGSEALRGSTRPYRPATEQARVARRRGSTDGERLDVPAHGWSGYKRGCRCRECRAANTEKSRRRRATGKPKQHGSATTYSNYGCRCEPCREAWRAHMRPRNGGRS